MSSMRTLIKSLPRNFSLAEQTQLGILPEKLPIHSIAELLCPHNLDARADFEIILYRACQLGALPGVEAHKLNPDAGCWYAETTFLIKGADFRRWLNMNREKINVEHNFHLLSEWDKQATEGEN